MRLMRNLIILYFLYYGHTTRQTEIYDDAGTIFAIFCDSVKGVGLNKAKEHYILRK